VTEEQHLTDYSSFEDCSSFEDRLNDLIDRRISLADDPILGQHALQCAECARILKDYRQLIEIGPPVAANTGDLEVAGYRCNPASGSCGKFSLSGIVRRSKLKWAVSLSPSLVALLIVAVSMFKGSVTYEQFPEPNTGWEGSGFQKFVAQARDTGVGSRVGEGSLPIEAYSYDPIVDSVFIRSGVIDRVQNYSNAIYQFANAPSQLRACDWRNDVVVKVTSPYAPIHSQVPYRGEFSAIPRFRFLLGFTLRLIEMAYSGHLELDLSKPELGVQAEDLRKAAMA
jgi:hypothetical protein